MMTEAELAAFHRALLDKLDADSPHEWVDPRVCTIYETQFGKRHLHSVRCARCGLTREACAEPGCYHYFVYTTLTGVHSEHEPACVRCCASSHEPPDTACTTYLEGVNGRCVYCDHAESCHPGPGATCWVFRPGER